MRETAISYTRVDEAPALATKSLLPVIEAYTRGCGITIEPADISLAGRIIANFPEGLTEEQKIPDHLELLGELAKTPEANIVKLPNISASVPQLRAAIKELQQKGYEIPDYPEKESTEEEKALRARFAKALGSAVNPVLRKGNSDRRSSAAVKEFGRNNAVKLGAWSKDSKSHVAFMSDGDFYATEKSMTLSEATDARIEYVARDGGVTVLKEKLPLEATEVIDTSTMSVRSLRAFYAEQIEEAKKHDLLLSLHLKATMMKVSDPVIFGHAVSVFYEPVFTKHAETFAELGVNPDHGIAGLYEKIKGLPEAGRAEIEADIKAVYLMRPKLAMVDSDKGITNLHLPNNIIIDASVPVVVRDSGKMWGPDGELHDTKAMIPDRCYATIYQAVFEDCRTNGAFDQTTMGAVSNVGLMAFKAEEYGSHDKTFIAPGDGTIRVVDAAGAVMLENAVEKDDIFRMCQTKDIAVKDWVKLAVTRARITGSTAIFWLDETRAHHAQLITMVEAYLEEHDTSGLDIRVMSPVDAMRETLARVRRGEDTISVTGNVLRDYLTDLFPILELGTSSRMLSVVPLIGGGALFETGAGGSAPKHVQQFLAEGHLRWDSLGEMLALGASLEHVSRTAGNRKAETLAGTLDAAISRYLEERRSPSRKVNELDTRGSHFYFASYWAQALAAQTDDAELQARFAAPAGEMVEKEETILGELLAAQGRPVDIGGYYLPDQKASAEAMRPSATWNAILASLARA